MMVREAHGLLHRFCSEMTMHYGDESVVPNMHFQLRLAGLMESLFVSSAPVNSIAPPLH